MSTKNALKQRILFSGLLRGRDGRTPSFYLEPMKGHLGSLWEWLPEGTIHHDPCAYLKAKEEKVLQPVLEPTVWLELLQIQEPVASHI